MRRAGAARGQDLKTHRRLPFGVSRLRLGLHHAHRQIADVGILSSLLSAGCVAIELGMLRRHLG
jgi:hypothetical protein